MKKVISVKEIMIVLISVVLITVATTVFAVEPVLGGNNNVPTVSQDEYENAQISPEDKNTTNNASNNITNNSVKTYNNSNKTDLPQTGIEDYNIGILLVICVASAIYAYKKVNDYKNI